MNTYITHICTYMHFYLNRGKGKRHLYGRMPTNKMEEMTKLYNHYHLSIIGKITWEGINGY